MSTTIELLEPKVRGDGVHAVGICSIWMGLRGVTKRLSQSLLLSVDVV